MYLYNKNILKYVEIVGSEPKSMILNTEGRSNIYLFLFFENIEKFREKIMNMNFFVQNNKDLCGFLPESTMRAKLKPNVVNTISQFYTDES